jgi:large subunit ribosomal protein L25
MSTVLNTQPREKVGTRSARKLRANGRIPANLQSEGEGAHVDISIDEAEFLTTRRRHEHLYELEVGGAKEAAIVRELEWDVFSERIIHVEFRRVDLKKKTEVEVELTFEGHSKGVLNHLITHISVMALPAQIPDSIPVSIKDLEIGTVIHGSDLIAPEGVELMIEPDAMVAVIVEAKVHEEPAETEPGAGLEGAAPAEGVSAPESPQPPKE